jgi:hypothetical protein
MPDRDADPLIVAISSRTLFDMEDSHALFEREGIDAYADFQRTARGRHPRAGHRVPLVRKLLRPERGAPAEAPRVEVILISRNSPTPACASSTRSRITGWRSSVRPSAMAPRHIPTSGRSARTCSCPRMPRTCATHSRRA